MDLVERVAKLEVMVSETRDDVREIKTDVRALLADKYRGEGAARRIAIAASILTALIASPAVAAVAVYILK